MTNLAKIIGFSSFGLILVSGVILFVSGAIRLCIFIYKIMSVGKAAIICVCLAILFGLIFGFASEHNKER